MAAERGVFFGDVDVAADLWLKIPAVTRASGSSTQPLENHDNGDSAPPKVGDLLVYGREYLRTGHSRSSSPSMPGPGASMLPNRTPEPAVAGRRSCAQPRSARTVTAGGCRSYLLGWKRIAGE